MTIFGTVYLESLNSDRPDLIAVHTAPPLFSLMNLWKRDLELISEFAHSNPDAILIGDFNATMKHGSLSKIQTHSDVLNYSSRWNRGTWNQKLPAFFRTPIDHVLIPDQYRVVSAETRVLPGSDHAGIFTEIQHR